MLHNVDFGIKFLTECSKYTERTGKFEDVQNIKERCLLMLEEAVTVVNVHLPSQHDIFKSLSKLHPSCVLNQTTKPAFHQLPFLHLAGSNINTIEEQYRKIIFVDWVQEPAFLNGIPNESENFWVGDFQHTLFTELATYALDCLTTPISNAVVERVFSMVSSIKTKPRNRMELKLLDAIVRIRSELLLQEKCCKDFFPSHGMISLYSKTDFTNKAVMMTVKENSSDSFLNNCYYLACEITCIASQIL